MVVLTDLGGRVMGVKWCCLVIGLPRIGAALLGLLLGALVGISRLGLGPSLGALVDSGFRLGWGSWGARIWFGPIGIGGPPEIGL